MKRLLISAFSILAAVTAAQAHHSFAQFDSSKTLTLEGTIKKFEWTNPHIWIWVVVPDGKGGEETWGMEGQSPSGLARAGWSKRSFVPGEKVKIEMHPMSDGSKAAMFLRATKTDGTVLVPAP